MKQVKKPCENTNDYNSHRWIINPKNESLSLCTECRMVVTDEQRVKMYMRRKGWKLSFESYIKEEPFWRLIDIAVGCTLRPECPTPDNLSHERYGQGNCIR